MMLELRDITVRYGEKTAVAGVDLSVRPGEWWMVAGPNGAGKSTLARAILQGVPYGGRMAWEEKDMRLLRPRERARLVGMLSQTHPAGYAFTVRDVVALGRYAYHGGFLKKGDPDGEDQIRSALAQTELTGMENRSILTLSGGETQRVFLAQVLAQDPRLMILDEPANHLDLPYQQLLFSLIQTWLKTPGRAVISVVHDLTIARRFGTHALLMHQGRAVARGEISQALDRENLSAVYGMDVFAWMQELLRDWQTP